MYIIVSQYCSYLKSSLEFVSEIYQDVRNPNTGTALWGRHEFYVENGGLDFINKIYKTFLKYANYRHIFFS